MLISSIAVKYQHSSPVKIQENKSILFYTC